jgi:sugar transferase (PEP-CTERM/EpsH1 system associated)
MKLLWVNSRLTYPLDQGGKIRTYNILKNLSQEHEIDILTLATLPRDEQHLPAVREICRNLVVVPIADPKRGSPQFLAGALWNLFSSLPYSISKYKSSEMKKKASEMVENEKYDLVISDFLTPTVNLKLPLEQPKAIFQHNVESIIWKRLAEQQRWPLRKIYFSSQWKRMDKYEKSICRQYDGLICVSREDADHLQYDYGAKLAIPIDTGVDTEYFHPEPDLESRTPMLVFTGTMDWLPNRDGVRWFLDKVFPIVSEEAPDAGCVIVGKNPPEDILKRAVKDKNLEVTGWVEDVRKYIHKAWIYVVPLRVGGGTRIKIFEAMACAKPVVSTKLGAEGLPLANEKNCFMEDEPQAMADTILHVIDNRQMRQKIGNAARQLVENKHDWSIIARQFSAACQKIISEAQRQR